MITFFYYGSAFVCSSGNGLSERTFRRIFSGVQLSEARLSALVNLTYGDKFGSGGLRLSRLGRGSRLI